MEAEAIVTTVESGTRRSIGESLELEFVNVGFRAIRSTEYSDVIAQVTIKEPAWLAKLQPTAPLNGYLMERGEFIASFGKDDRIKPGLRVTIEVHRY
jgi:hypothetical protein